GTATPPSPARTPAAVSGGLELGAVALLASSVGLRTNLMTKGDNKIRTTIAAKSFQAPIGISPSIPEFTRLIHTIILRPIFRRATLSSLEATTETRLFLQASFSLSGPWHCARA